MSEIFKGIVYLSDEQYREKYNAKTLDVNTLYVTPDNGNSGGGEGTPVDAYTKSETDALLEDKADKDTTYTKAEVDEIKQDLQDQIATSTGGEFTKVTVGGEYQPSFDADTKADKTYADAIVSYVDGFGAALERVQSSIPTKTSQLENDSGFITSESIEDIQLGIPVRNFIGV